MKETESAGGIILNQEGYVLLVEQKRGVWSLPKGHLEGKETPLEAALREIEEETGITRLEFKKELGSYKRFKIGKDGRDDAAELKTMHIFLFTTNEKNTRPQDPTIVGLAWVSPEEIAQRLTHPRDREFVTAVLPQIRRDPAQA
ncbi:MAG: NUDIX domain-containing protein [Candidatus Omnitrophica bacterium]|nr:NUDIX domain-containing protein [Candidatus Omnitrophota bacterium]